MNVVWYIGGTIVALWVISSVFRQKQRKNKIIHIVDDNCTGCQRCLKKCRHRVLDKTTDKKEAHVFVKNPTYCTACGDCLSACKFKALELITKK